MEQAIPLPEMGHRWLDRAKLMALARPSTNIVLEHSGVSEREIVPQLTSVAEQWSKAANDGVVVRKRLLSVMVEAVDNLGKHSLGIMGDASFALLVQDAAGYCLITGNAVPAAVSTHLEHRIGLLNGMEREDLREHYLKLLANKARSSKGGAGLGLLTLARKCSLPILFTTESLGPYTAYITFSLRVDAADTE